MKKFKNIILFAAAALPLSLVSCQEEIGVGPLDPEGCYGVYFPEQGVPGEQEPNDSKTFTFTARRTNTDGAIGVPVTVLDTNDVYQVSDIVFADGEKETTFKVRYPGVKTGNDYPCTIRISDPQYYSKYSANTIELSWTVSVVKWNKLGEGKDNLATYRDGVMSNAFSLEPAETKCEIYERADMPGYFRLKGVYTNEFIQKIIGEEGDFSQLLSDSKIEINATDSSKVWIDAQNIGVFWPPYGNFFICSNVPESEFAQDFGQAGDIYGKYDKKNGVITFPSQSLIWGFDNQPFGFIDNEFTRIVMPGFTAADYRIALKVLEHEDGQVPAKITMSKDIKRVGYAVLEGHLSEFDAETKAATFGTPDCEVKNIQYIDASDTVKFQPENTGEYTVIAAGFDEKGQNKTFAYAHFRYLKDGDHTKDVVLDVNLYKSDKFVEDGLTRENSLCIFLSGTGIEELKVGIFPTKSFEKDEEKYINILKKNPSLPAEVIAMVNQYNFSGAQPHLAPGCEYTLIAWASNGYASVVKTASCSTDGTYSFIYDKFEEDAIQDDFHEVGDYLGTWNYYAVDMFSDNSLKQFGGKVEVTLNEELSKDFKDYLVLDFKNLFSTFSGISTFKDDISHYVYDKKTGRIQTSQNTFDPFEFKGYNVFGLTLNAASGNNPDNRLDLNNIGYLKGGFFGDGYFGFVPSTFGKKPNEVTFDGMTVFGFIDERLTKPFGAITYVSNMLFVRPDKDDSGLDKEEPVKKSALNVDRHSLDNGVAGNCFDIKSFVVGDK